jgi:aspartate/methionine/tyrosine aminotransferase
MEKESVWSSASWGRHFGPVWDTKGKQVSMLAKRLMANRSKRLFSEPQGRGNYFTYKEAIEILGLDWHDIYKEGYLTPDPDKFLDMGYMYSLQGPPNSAIEAMREKLNAETVSPYPPDLIFDLREIAAQRKFKRSRSPEFEVMGVEGAQGGIGFTFLSFLNEGDEVIITDPGYMHFRPGPNVEGAVVRPIALTKENNYRLDPDEFRENITLRTKMVIVCDPINPFGTVQSKESLIEIAKIAKEHDIIVFNNITHGTHQTNPNAMHYPMTSLFDECDVDHVISTSGMSKGYGLAGLRIGFLSGHPDLLKAPAMLRMEVTKTHIQLLGQYGALAALGDEEYIRHTTQNIRRNFSHLKETIEMTKGVSLPVEPDYGFCTIIDVVDTGVSAQELTVALFKFNIAVIPGDALGDVGTTRYLRLNYSTNKIEQLDKFREVLPLAIDDAKKGIYRDDVIKWFKQKDNYRAKRIVKELSKGFT